LHHQKSTLEWDCHKFAAVKAEERGIAECADGLSIDSGAERRSTVFDYIGSLGVRDRDDSFDIARESELVGCNDDAVAVGIFGERFRGCVTTPRGDINASDVFAGEHGGLMDGRTRVRRHNDMVVRDRFKQVVQSATTGGSQEWFDAVDILQLSCQST
jgi:hypothetical protein